MKLTLSQARHLALHTQLYKFSGHKDKAGALEAIKTIGYVQIDTISVIERAHHHTLYNRVQNYHPDMLTELLNTDKAIWEFWGHAASYLPMEDYAFYKYRMHTFPNGGWEKKLWDTHKDLAEFVISRITNEGPLSSKDFEDPRQNKVYEAWGNAKPAKLMLELLMWKGDLIVSARNKFQRVYDLTERVIPNYKEIKAPPVDKRAEFMVNRAILAHGIVSESDINKHLPIANKEAVALALQKLIKADLVQSLQIEGLADTYYTSAELLAESISDKPFDNRVRLLSPFDNAVIMRPRLKQLFDFEYTIECYVTPAKRIYGYWSCPILYKDNFVGRLDPKADRKTKLLTVHSIYIDKKVWKQAAFQKEFTKELERFAAFNGCTDFSINKINLI
jgi:uncharacterized protein YcaQ